MTRRFALEALGIALSEALRFAIAAKMDEHFLSDIRHLHSVTEANKEDADKVR